ncbi:hypothetical protein QTP88_019864 [Uroleucon formosanum]
MKIAHRISRPEISKNKYYFNRAYNRNSYQGKWKILHDSYTRELAKQKNDMKSGSATKFRKKYIFFDQLRFLDTTTKPTDDSIELNNHEGNLEESGSVTEENINKMRCKGKPKKRHSDEDLLEVLKKKYYQQETKQSLDYENEDRLFLLFLCKDLQSIPDHIKLNVKSQMIIASTKQTAYSSVQLNPLTTINQYSHPIRPQFNINSYSSQLAPPAIPTNINRPLNTQSEFGIEIPVIYQNQTRTQHQDQLWPTTYSPEDASSVHSDLSNDFIRIKKGI